MRNILLLITMLFLFILQGCATGGGGITSIALPDVQVFEYKDIVSCAKLDAVPGFSDCRIKVGDTGVFITVRVQTSKIPTDPAESTVPIPE